MSYPLHDSGYILWAGDLEARVRDLLGQSFRGLGVDPRMLLRSYYGGASMADALAAIVAEHSRKDAPATP